MDAGRINGWRCNECGRVTYGILVDDGVTPMFITCRADGVHPNEALSACKGTAESMMFPEGEPPPYVLHGVQWEWYRPRGMELAAMRKFEPDGFLHVMNGGLELRKLTEEGRRMLDTLAMTGKRQSDA